MHVKHTRLPYTIAPFLPSFSAQWAGHLTAPTRLPPAESVSVPLSTSFLHAGAQSPLHYPLSCPPVQPEAPRARSYGTSLSWYTSPLHKPHLTFRFQTAVAPYTLPSYALDMQGRLASSHLAPTMQTACWACPDPTEAPAAMSHPFVNLSLCMVAL